MSIRLRTTLAVTAAITLTGFLATATTHAHEGGGDGEHLAIGFYYGHDGSYEAPAQPLGPATLLVDTHPWELDSVIFTLNPGLGGYYSEIPGFRPLAIEDEEYGGHGFYTWLNNTHGFDTPDLYLHILDSDPDLQIIDPATQSQVISPFHLGANAANHHLIYFVADSASPVPGDLYSATFYLSDANGIFADSESFTLNFRIIPEPASATLIGVMITTTLLRRRR